MEETAKSREEKKKRYTLFVIGYSFKPATGNRQRGTGNWKPATRNKERGWIL
jgi:hypothetical protein